MPIGQGESRQQPQQGLIDGVHSLASPGVVTSKRNSAKCQCHRSSSSSPSTSRHRSSAISSPTFHRAAVNSTPLAVSVLIPLLLLVLSPSPPPPVTCDDIVSSTAHIQSLMYLERHLVDSLTSYLTNVEEEIQHVKSYLSEFAFTAGRPQFAGTYADNLMDNPLQAFQLLKRLTINLKKIEKVMHQDSWAPVSQLMEDYQTLLPRAGDFDGAALALIRLQDTYNLSITDLSYGKIQRQTTPIIMSARDCLYLGKSAFNHGYYGHSLDWFEEALLRAHREGNRTATVDEITPFYQMAAQEHDKAENEIRVQNYQRYSDRLRIIEGDSKEYADYQRLCRGEKIHSNINDADLSCHYATNNQHPLLVLHPAKVEVVSRRPYVVLFHQIVSDSQIQLIKELSTPALTRARVVTDSSGKEESISTVARVSQTAWLREFSHPTIAAIKARIEAVTGLSADTEQQHCEQYQVANYGIGGHYVPHYDYIFKDVPEPEREKLLTDENRHNGDRISTFMIYLSDVLSGGSTVFPYLGLRVAPTKGAALMWYNLHRNGEGDTNTVHGACPVLLGEKWVMNFWFRENGQMFRRPCTLDPNQ